MGWHGRLLASGGLDGTVRVWQAAAPDDGRQPTDTGAGPEDSPSPSTGAASSGGWRLLATTQSHAGGVRGVTLSANGRLLASGGIDGIIRLCETPSGRVMATLQGQAGGA